MSENPASPKAKAQSSLGRTVFIVLAIAVAGYALYSYRQPYVYPLAGQQAPKIALASLDGAPLPVAEDIGKKVVVLNFWATWCPPCRLELPEFAKLATEFPDRPVAFYAVATDQERELIASVVDEITPRPPVAFDAQGAANNAYQIHYLPTTLIIDANGVIQHVHTGFTNMTISEIRAGIEELLKP